MPLQKILFKPGINRENTRYTTEGGWYDGDKIRFRQGTPEKIGGWEQISSARFEGTCRSLWNWSSLGGVDWIGVGTNLKYYIEQGLGYYDVTPIRATTGNTPLSNPFTATAGSTTITVTDVSHGALDGDFVSFRGAIALSTQTYTADSGTDYITFTTALANGTTLEVFTTGTVPGGLAVDTRYYVINASGATCQLALTNGGSPINISSAGTGTQTFALETGITASVLNSNFQITVVDGDNYTIEAPVAATAYDLGGGGTSVSAYYEIRVGVDVTTGVFGWGAGTWGAGTWGIGESSLQYPRMWNANNFGQNLIAGYRGGPLYYWNATIGVDPVAFTDVTSNGTDPTVFEYPGGLIDGTTVRLETDGTLPTGFSTSTIYYVVNADSVSNTFELSATFGGSGIVGVGAIVGAAYVANRMIPISSLGGADGYAPLYQNYFLVSDASRFTMVFGTNEIGSTELDPMLVRWSDQESLTTWYPAVTNQAGFIRLSHGSEIITAMQVRQEILVWTDSSLYSMQYLGAPYVWGSQLLMDNVSIVSQNAATLASGVTYWMGLDKFYKYDGRVQTLRCDLRQYIFQDINRDQFGQVFSGTNEGFNEVWWFYCSGSSTVIDKYAVYNYAEDIWYYGTMGRTAWSDSALSGYPVAATYDNNLVYHEYGNNDNTTGTAVAMDAYISSSEFDIGDGHNFGFVWRLLPDVTFRGSDVASPDKPTVTMSLIPLRNSGSGYTTPPSVGGSDNEPVVQTQAGTAVQVEEFTGQINIRVRGRQMSFKIESNQLGCQWQLGAPRIDIRPDGRRGG